MRNQMEKGARLSELLYDPKLGYTLLRIEQPEDAQRFLAEHDIEMSMEEVHQLGKALHVLAKNQGELAEEDLALVAGGFFLADGTIDEQRHSIRNLLAGYDGQICKTW